MLFWFFLRATNDLSKQANTLCYNVRDVNSGTSFLIYLPYVLLLPYTEYSVASSLNRCFFCSTLSSLLSFHQPIYSPLLSSFAQDVCCLFCHCSDIWNWMCVTNIFRRDLLVLFYCRSVVGEMVVANSIVTMQPPYRKKRFHRYSWCHCILLVFFFCYVSYNAYFVFPYSLNEAFPLKIYFVVIFFAGVVVICRVSSRFLEKCIFVHYFQTVVAFTSQFCVQSQRVRYTTRR